MEWDINLPTNETQCGLILNAIAQKELNICVILIWKLKTKSLQLK